MLFCISLGFSPLEVNAKAFVNFLTGPGDWRLNMKYEILNCLKGFAGFCRFIMKYLTYVLKFTAIAVNTYFLSFVLSFVRSGFGGHPLSLLAWVASSSVLAIPPVTLITIALTFQKKFKILTSVLRIIAIILNAHLLIHLIWFHHEILDDMALWAYLIYCGLPFLNLVALAVTFIKVKKKTPVYPVR